MDALEFLQKFSDYIQKADILSWLFSYPKWWFTMGLYKICSVAESLIATALKVLSFMDNDKVTQLYNGFKIVSWTVLAVTLGFIGFKMIMGKNVKIKDTLLHIIILGCLIVNIPALMTGALNLNKTLYSQSKNLVLADSGAQSSDDNTLAFNLLKTNVADLEYLAYQGYDKLESTDSIKNNLTTKTLKFADLHQILTPKDVKQLKKDSKNDEVENLQKYVTVNAEGKTSAKEIKNGWFSMFEEGTFRYKGNLLLLNVSFIVLSVFYFMQFCKLVIMVVDLVQVKIYAPLVLASDIETAKKTKQMVIDILGSLFTIAALGMSTVLFNSFYAYLVGLKLNPIVFFFVGVLGAVGFIKGSDSVAKYFGINTSVKEGLVGAMAGLGALKAGQLAMNGAGAVADKVGKAKDLGQKSYQKASQSVQNGASKAGQAIGQLSERGAGGFAKDMANSAGKSVGNKAKDMSNKMSQPFKNAKDNYNEGVASGLATGHSNSVSENKQKQADAIAKHDVDSAQRINSEPVRFDETENRSSGGNEEGQTDTGISMDQLADSNNIGGGSSSENGSNVPMKEENTYQNADKSTSKGQLPPLESRQTSGSQTKITQNQDSGSSNSNDSQKVARPGTTNKKEPLASQPMKNSGSTAGDVDIERKQPLSNDSFSGGTGTDTSYQQPSSLVGDNQSIETVRPSTSNETIGEEGHSMSSQIAQNNGSSSSNEPSTSYQRASSTNSGSQIVHNDSSSAVDTIGQTTNSQPVSSGGSSGESGTNTNYQGASSSDTSSQSSVKSTQISMPTVHNERATTFQESLPKSADLFVSKPTSNGTSENRVSLSQPNSVKTQTNSATGRPKLETNAQRASVNTIKPQQPKNETFNYSIGSSKVSKPNKYENYFKG